jgi:UDP-N-acetylmuramate dehydrogenase
VRVATTRDLLAVAQVVADTPVPTLVIGRGSNLLVADEGLAGLGIVLQGEFESIEVDRDAQQVRAGGAVPLPVLARRVAAEGLTGLEFFVGIPGSVGGAVRMNAGGHGRTTGEVLEHATVVGLRDRAPAPSERTPEALQLSYRHSDLSASDVVTYAVLRASTDDPGACATRIDEIVRWRREHQPGGANAGSVFRNPTGDSAGRIIDAAGLKGLQVGGARVSEKHANFFQADEDATARDVYDLVRAVQRRVADATGICLQPELQLVGFDEPHDDEKIGNQ